MSLPFLKWAGDKQAITSHVRARLIPLVALLTLACGAPTALGLDTIVVDGVYLVEYQPGPMERAVADAITAHTGTRISADDVRWWEVQKPLFGEGQTQYTTCIGSDGRCPGQYSERLGVILVPGHRNTLKMIRHELCHAAVSGDHGDQDFEFCKNTPVSHLN